MQRMPNKSTRESWIKKPLSSGVYQRWLIDPQSLTAKLQQHFAHFQVKPLAIRHAKANQDEYKALQISSRTQVLIRNVFLLGNHKPVVFAHSILPKKGLRGRWFGLKNLGATPLGALLFSNPQVKRSALRFKKIAQHHPLFKVATATLIKKPAVLWARRSVFSYQQAQIMVTEVFLPTIVELIEDETP